MAVKISKTAVKKTVAKSGVAKSAASKGAGGADAKGFDWRALVKRKDDLLGEQAAEIVRLKRSNSSLRGVITGMKNARS